MNLKTELLEHAARVLATQPTRTLGLRALADRIAVQLRTEVAEHRLLELLRQRPDLFAVAVIDAPLGDGWDVPDEQYHIAELRRAGAVPSPTVVLLELIAPIPADVPDDTTAALHATLADAHAAVADLLRMERAAELPSGVAGAALVELDQLRAAYPRRRAC